MAHLARTKVVSINFYSTGCTSDALQGTYTLPLGCRATGGMENGQVRTMSQKVEMSGANLVTWQSLPGVCFFPLFLSFCLMFIIIVMFCGSIGHFGVGRGRGPAGCPWMLNPGVESSIEAQSRCTVCTWRDSVPTQTCPTYGNGCKESRCIR